MTKIYNGQVDTYTVIDPNPIAIGPLAYIWRARNERSDLFCIKSFVFIRKDEFRRYLREVAARKHLVNPNILPISDYGYSEETQNETMERTPFIVMPYCSGGDLRRFLDSVDFLSIETAIPILKQVALAVDYAHEKGIIHGDIKPSNILFTTEDRNHVVLSDFGIARFATEEITATPPEGGTLGYLSPEQIANNQPTPLSDIYSLAVVAFECLTGGFPFDTKATAYSQMRAKVEGEPFYPKDIRPNLPKEVADALMEGLQRVPSKRPSTAMEFVENLSRKNNKDKMTRKTGFNYWWNSLSNNQKIAFITAVLTTFGTIITALISLIK